MCIFVGIHSISPLLEEHNHMHHHKSHKELCTFEGWEARHHTYTHLCKTDYPITVGSGSTGIPSVAGVTATQSHTYHSLPVTAALPVARRLPGNAQRSPQITVAPSSL